MCQSIFYTLLADSVQLAMRGHNDSQIDYSYDARDALATVLQTNSGPKVMRYTRDKVGRRTRLQFGFDFDVTYAYTPTGVNHAISAIMLGNQYNWTQTLDSLERPVAQTLPNGVQSTIGYDASLRLSAIEHRQPADNSILSRFAYGYDDAGNRTHKDEVIGGLKPLEFRSSYSYDNANRLTQATAPHETFNYDLVGNRNFNVSGQYNAANQLLTDGKFTYTYDLNGNLALKIDATTTEKTEYVWDSDNQLTQVKIKSDGVNVSKQVGYKYDALGRRIEKVVLDLRRA